MSKAQNDFLRDLFNQGRTITRLEAMHYGIQNLTARIADLRNANMDVRCTIKRDLNGARYGEFFVPRTMPAVI